MIAINKKIFNFQAPSVFAMNRYGALKGICRGNTPLLLCSLVSMDFLGSSGEGR